MHLFVLTVALGTVFTPGFGNPTTAKGLHFIGVGYDILRGNPDGHPSKGGIDPELKTTRKILKLTWNEEKLSVNKKYKVPDQIVFADPGAFPEKTVQEVFSGTRSYQDKLKAAVKVDGDVNTALWKFAFSLSTMYRKVSYQTFHAKNVFYEEKTVHNLGKARYQLDLVKWKRFPVTNEFAAAVCNLPQTYDQMTYRRFIRNWGTHIVSEVELGSKKIERYRSSYTDFFKYAMKNVKSAVSVSGGYLGFSSSLSVNFKRFTASMKTGTSFGSEKEVFRCGTPTIPEPTGLKLVSIDRVFDDSFFKALKKQYQCNLAQRRTNVKKILKEYSSLEGVRTSPQDPTVRIPLTWPLGTYGLPMANSGCPNGGFWRTGWRYHDTEDDNPSSSWSNPYDLAGHLSKSNMEQKFCMKTNSRTSRYNLPWPEGKYCIFKKENCPADFEDAHIRWDDEDHKNNNKEGGTLPEGSYGRNTYIEYCCRTDGDATEAIRLPTGSPFVLIKANTHLCQKVDGMVEKSQYFSWDTEDNDPQSRIHGPINAELSPYRNIKVHYCYYT